jgi:hypothetical protein
MGHPWIIAGILIAFGVAACFFGAFLFDWVVAILAGIVGFFVVAMIMDTFGGFNVMKVKQALKAGPIAFALFSFVLAAAAGFLAGFVVKKTARIAKGILGCVVGVFIGFLIYGLLLGQIFPSAVWLYIATEVVCFIAGGILVYRYEKVILLQLTAIIGAYTIVRGISLIAGGFPSEFSVIGEMASGTFVIPGTFYAYLAGFIALAVGGTIFQVKKEFGKHLHYEGDEILEDDNYNRVDNESKGKFN